MPRCDFCTLELLLLIGQLIWQLACQPAKACRIAQIILSMLTCDAATVLQGTLRLQVAANSGQLQHKHTTCPAAFPWRGGP